MESEYDDDENGNNEMMEDFNVRMLDASVPSRTRVISLHMSRSVEMSSFVQMKDVARSIGAAAA
jgi:hypothetical protein